MTFPRSTGILLHPISLPSRGGIGDFGPSAYEFLDFLSRSRQGLWQVLPLNPPADGTSPYSSTSAFAGNPLLISLERLAEHGWLDPGSISALTARVEKIDYDQVKREKLPLIRQAAENFLNRASPEARQRFENFCTQNAWWLADYVAFDALRQTHGSDWSRWPGQLARRDPGVLDAFRQNASFDLELRRVIQFFFWEQWRAFVIIVRKSPFASLATLRSLWTTTVPMFGRTVICFA